MPIRTMKPALPFEVSEFENLLRKPNSDPTGFAGYFNSGEVWAARVPARLDVMGGIADYSGANVCETVLGHGMLMAVQARTDRTLRIRSAQVGPRSLPVETRIPLDYFRSGDAVGNYAQIRELCHANPISSWAAYIVGSIFTLLKEESIELPYGFSFLLMSAVPMNVGIGSSAAVEIGTLSCLNAYLGLRLDGARIARLGQMAENHVVGAPCGIMDQIAVASGRETNSPISSAAPAPSLARWISRRTPASLASTPWSAIPWRAMRMAMSASARSWASASSMKSAPVPAAPR